MRFSMFQLPFFSLGADRSISHSRGDKSTGDRGVFRIPTDSSNPVFPFDLVANPVGVSLLYQLLAVDCRGWGREGFATSFIDVPTQSS